MRANELTTVRCPGCGSLMEYSTPYKTKIDGMDMHCCRLYCRCGWSSPEVYGESEAAALEEAEAVAKARDEYAAYWYDSRKNP